MISTRLTALATAMTLSMTLAATAQRDAAEMVVARFAASVGAPTATGPDGADRDPGFLNLVGTTVTTGAADRVAMLVMRTANASAAEGDWVLVGPDTELRFDPALAQPGEPLFNAMLQHGTVRLVTGDATTAHLIAVRSGDLVTRALNNADVLVSVEPGDAATYAVNAGEAVIQKGDRSIALRAGMTRHVVDGKVRAAKRLAADAWTTMIAVTHIDGVELPRVAAVPKSRPVNDAGGALTRAPRPGAAGAPSLGAERGENPGAGGRAGAGENARTGDERPAAEPAAREESETKAPVYARMVTSKGTIVLELDPTHAPISVANFAEYASNGFYDGTIFHRVMADFMIQGGGFDADLKRKPTRSPIQNEWDNGLKNQRGTIAMARTSAPNSATSQFYINVVDNPSLDVPRGGAAYAVFGRVISGMDAVDAIRYVPTGVSNGMRDVPVAPVTIESVKIISREEAGA